MQLCIGWLRNWLTELLGLIDTVKSGHRDGSNVSHYSNFVLTGDSTTLDHGYNLSFHPDMYSDYHNVVNTTGGFWSRWSVKLTHTNWIIRVWYGTLPVSSLGQQFLETSIMLRNLWLVLSPGVEKGLSETDVDVSLYRSGDRQIGTLTW